MTAATSTPFTALGGLVLVGVMFRMVLVLVEKEVVVVMVALVVMMVTLGLNLRWMWQLLDWIFWRSAPPKGGRGHPLTVCHYSKDHFVV